MISSFVAQLPLNSGFVVSNPTNCANQYLTSVEDLISYLPFLQKMSTKDSTSSFISKFSPHIDTGLNQIINSANDSFAPTNKNYRLDLDTQKFIETYA